MKQYYQKSTNLEEIVKSEKNIEVIEELIEEQEEKLTTKKGDMITCSIIPFITFMVLFVMSMIYPQFSAEFIFNCAFASIFASIGLYLLEKRAFASSLKALKHLYKVHEEMQQEHENLQKNDKKIDELILTTEINNKINQERYKNTKLKELLLVEFFYRNYKKIIACYEKGTLNSYLSSHDKTPEEISFIYDFIANYDDKNTLKLVRNNKSE